MLQTRQEIPYAAAVEIEEFDESGRREGGGLVRVGAVVWVERDSQKAIVIGKRGAMLKNDRHPGPGAARAAARVQGVPAAHREGGGALERARRRRSGSSGSDVSRSAPRWWPSSAGPTSGSPRSSTGSCGRRAAIVEDVPGVTRDRNYADVDWDAPRALGGGHRRLRARVARPPHRARCGSRRSSPWTRPPPSCSSWTGARGSPRSTAPSRTCCAAPGSRSSSR